ncbi:MAG: hypothetical protein JWP09_209 [Candidatus Taylorbacteria bacterium]|nr:hypothetical protein [Candidatus Taylorbacteria bacterium]
MNKNKKTVYIISAIVVAIILFYGGMKYGESTNVKGGSGNFQAGARMSGGRTSFAGGMGGMTAGDIVDISEGSITLKTRDGSSKVVLIGTSTPVTKSAPGLITDLKAGDSVMISGKTNPDGSVVASEIQERNKQQ